MDEGVQKYLEQPQVSTLKLSEAIRIGHRLVPENRHSHNECALGAACWALTGKFLQHNVEFNSGKNGAPNTYCVFLAGLTNTPADIVQQAEFKHMEATPRLEIADWLESIGY